tara:strand:- start:6985 stop:7722 length:738 start_codon:yes stop_codon:yes gene_type:complete
MQKNKILDRLKNDDDYYGQFGRQYLSNSDIYNLLKNPAQFRVPQAKTKPMLEGSYFHTKMLEPQKLDQYETIDSSTRSTKKYKDACPSGEIMLLTKEKENLDYLCDIMSSNMEMCKYIYAEGNEFEVPAIQNIMSLDWKGKADIVNHKDDLIIDIKTSSDMDKFMYSANTYNYDSQAYIYQRLFNKQLVFFVIDKSNGRLGIFECSAEFLESGQNKVERAIEVYHKFYSDESTEDITNYIHRQTL